MNICIYGAGAIGGYLGALLAYSGQEVTLIARGPHLAVMREQGLRLHLSGETLVTHPRCTDDPHTVGPQDYVIVTLKAHSLSPIADQLLPLLGPETAVVTASNGIPWWYFYKLEGPFENKRLTSVDPEGRVWETLGPERAIGCVVYPACEMSAPGEITHQSGERFSLGEPDGTRSSRSLALSAALQKAGLKAPVRAQIRNEIWVKLWGNLCFNPISALTQATLDVVATDPGTQAIARQMMTEAQTIAEHLGVTLGVSLEQRIAGAAAVGPHRTSMLQDLLQGRPMEIDALVTVVQELGVLVGVPTPYIDTILALVRQRARLAGCYPTTAGS
ncbi:2-dehydropantoate 2-reductase [Anthocerotibacter panamensis]|uniref:2-dehydropantoate 2-reductase n=1 Tax=Anthocerotibacter panamensis TaxID=2857077 RepID=UPI001C404F2F|nr:2-dehydropantoate 2-reductase [Anthocerotibacter panamensis]